jgi:hypothetical protein
MVKQSTPRRVSCLPGEGFGRYRHIESSLSEDSMIISTFATHRETEMANVGEIVFQCITSSRTAAFSTKLDSAGKAIKMGLFRLHLQRCDNTVYLHERLSERQIAGVVNVVELLVRRLQWHGASEQSL